MGGQKENALLKKCVGYQESRGQIRAIRKILVMRHTYSGQEKMFCSTFGRSFSFSPLDLAKKTKRERALKNAFPAKREEAKLGRSEKFWSCAILIRARKKCFVQLSVALSHFRPLIWPKRERALKKMRWLPREPRPN